MTNQGYDSYGLDLVRNILSCSERLWRIEGEDELGGGGYESGEGSCIKTRFKFVHPFAG